MIWKEWLREQAAERERAGLSRGLLYRALQRDNGTMAAIAVTSVLYAAAHFLSGREFPGDVVTVDLDQASVTVKATGKVYSFKPLGDVRPVVDAGGIFNYARKSGMIGAEG